MRFACGLGGFCRVMTIYHLELTVGWGMGRKVVGKKILNLKKNFFRNVISKDKNFYLF